MAYTKEQKNAYFKNLRAEWNKSKELAEDDQTAKALYRETGGSYSYYSFYFTLQGMQEHGFDGLPYVDCKTFKKWKEAGFTVMKGEKSKISGITWIHPRDKDGEEDLDYCYPKLYRLFHRSQVA